MVLSSLNNNILIHLIYALSRSIGYIVITSIKSTVLILIFSRLVLVVWIVGLCFVGVLMVVVQSYIENLMLHVLHRFHLVLNAFVVLKFSILVDYHICWSLYTCLLHVIRLLLLTILIHLESYKGSWSLNNVMLIFWLVISMWILIVAALWLGYYVISWGRWVSMLVIIFS